MLSSIDRKKYPFFVMSASAGSGKTYQLVLQYLSILLSSKYSGKYRAIVAITFTNKASLEMKNRIIDALYKLAEYKKGNEDRKTEAILEELKLLLQLEEKEILKSSAQALRAILHGYENFNVSTIDKFNLRLIKSFSSDLELPADFEVTLKEDEVLDEVLDLILSSIGEGDKKELTELLTEYARSNFREGSQWNFKRELKSFASSLSLEKNQGYIRILKEMTFDQGDYRVIADKMNVLNEEFCTFIDEFSECFYSMEIDPMELPYKSQTYNALLKISQLKECPTDSPILLSKRLKGYCLESGDTKALKRVLKDKLLAVEECYIRIAGELAFLKKYRSNFYNMALLKHIYDSLREHKERSKVIRISEFNEMISSLVKNEDAPYIYERFGVRFEHFLLDEFQDTSRLQWLNLLPLIRESLSYKNENLIVGDPKQSIYRFNNGLAEQFVSLPEVYNPENEAYIAETSSFFNSLGIKKPLTENYRSCPEIVEFNNKIFELLSSGLSDRFELFYEDVHQNPVSEDAGFVSVVSKEGVKRNLEQMVSNIISIIKKSVEDGFELGDICILTDRNALGVQLANELSKKDIPVFSQQSLLVSKNLQVRLLVSYMKWRMRPTMDTMKRQFAELYFRVRGDGEDRYFEFVQENMPESGKKYRFFNDERFLKEYFDGKERFFRPFENIYELTLQFLSLMGWEEIENPFLHQFVDLVFQFQNDRQSDLSKFIEYYDDNRETFALKMPDSENAVQLMTLHKAKGLEFPIVIIPEIDFKLGIHRNSRFFVETDSNILFTGLSQNSIVDEISQKAVEEKNLILLDKLNLLYVGFTRAEKRLYVFNHFDKGSNLGEIFHKRLVDSFDIKDKDGEVEFIAGKEQRKIESPSEEPKQDEVFYTPARVPIDLSKVQMVLNHEEGRSEQETHEERLFGDYFHHFMCEVDTQDDIDSTMQKMQRNDQTDLGLAERIQASAIAFFQSAGEQGLLDKVIKVYNERSILAAPSRIIRPDKVFIREEDVIVVDFKTGKPSPDHHEQIWNYKSALEEMYEKPVRAVLYYTRQDELIQI